MCNIMGEDCWIQAAVHWLAHSAPKVDLSTFFLPWAVSKHCCRGFITFASSTESLCKMHPPLSSSSCWELLCQDLCLAKERARRVTGFSVQFWQLSLKLHDWRDELSVARDDLSILLIMEYKLVLLKCWGCLVSPWWAHVVWALQTFSLFWKLYP